MEQPTSSRLPLRLLLLPAALALVVHLPVLRNDLTWDDRTLVAEHPRLGEPGFLAEAVTRDYGLEFGERIERGYYRPAFMTLAVALARAGGREPIVFHGASLIGFAALSVVFTLALDRLLQGRSPRFTLACGAIFAVHPLHTEPNAFFHAFPDLVVQGATLVVLARFAAAEGRGLEERSWLRPGLLAGAIGLAAALTKETAFLQLGAMAAALVLVACVAPERRSSRASTALGLLGGLGLAFALRVAGGIDSRPLGFLWAPLAPESAQAASWALARSIDLVIVPRVSVFDRVPPAGPNVLAAIALAIVFLLLAAAVLVAARRGRATIAVLLASAAGGLHALACVLADGVHLNERYIPTAPLLALIALAAHAGLRRLPAGAIGPAASRVVLVGLGALVLWCAAATVAGTRKARDTFTFWEALLADQPRSWYPRVALANQLLNDERDGERAERLVLEALDLAPDRRGVRLVALQLGAYWAKRGQVDRALPFVDLAAAGLPGDARVHHFRATCLFRLGRITEALDALRPALTLLPRDGDQTRLYVTLLAHLPAIPDETIVREVEAMRAAGIAPPEGLETREKIESFRKRLR